MASPPDFQQTIHPQPTRPALGQVMKERDELKRCLRAYVEDESRFNKGDREPFGSIPTEIGILARSLIK